MEVPVLVGLANFGEVWSAGVGGFSRLARGKYQMRRFGRREDGKWKWRVILVDFGGQEWFGLFGWLGFRVGVDLTGGFWLMVCNWEVPLTELVLILAGF